MAKAKGATAHRRPRSSRSLGLSASPRRRRALVEVEVDCSSEDNYLFAYLADEQTLGIFVRTLAPQSSGTLLTLRFLATEPRIPVTDVAAGLSERVAQIEADLEHELEAEEIDADMEAEISAELDAELARIQLPSRLAALSARDAAMGTARIKKIADVDELVPSGDGALDDGDDEAELCLDGEVIWVNPYRPSVKDNLHPGMGIRLPPLEERTRARLFALVGRFAYLT